MSAKGYNEDCCCTECREVRAVRFEEMLSAPKTAPVRPVRVRPVLSAVDQAAMDLDRRLKNDSRRDNYARRRSLKVGI